ncbi:hypothetical protein Aduo_000373 [Ancylostoma duodenale]
MGLPTAILFAVCIGVAIFGSTAANSAKREANAAAHGNQGPETASNVDGTEERFNRDRNGPKRRKRQVFKWHYATEPKKTTDSEDLTVYYRFNASISKELRDAFSRATKLWEDGTCLTFKENDDDKQYTHATYYNKHCNLLQFC